MKTALITGSTSGIGLGIAHHLAKIGCNIVLNGLIDINEVDKLTSSIKAHGVDCTFSDADLTVQSSVDKMMDDAIATFGKIDILVNNAGIQHVEPIDTFPPEKWLKIIQLDLVSAFFTIRRVIPLMKQQQFGRIINISSAHGLVASAYKSAYVAAKHGIVGLTKTVALEVAEHGITVNAVCPGYVKTPLVLNQIADTAKARGISEQEVIRDVMLGQQANKKFIEIDEVASFVGFLVSDEAGSITGAALAIDGGWTAH